MYQAYLGTVRNGQPIITETAILQEGASLIIMVVDGLTKIKAKTLSSEEARKEKKTKALDSLIGIIPSGFEFDIEDIRRERIEKRGLVE